MSKFKKTLFLFLVFILMLNIVVPSSLTRAEGESEDPAVTTQQSVTDDVYGATLLAAPGQVITDNLITSVTVGNTIKDSDGNEITSGPNFDSVLSIEFDWEIEANHSYHEGDTYTFQLPDNFKFPTSTPKEGEPEPELPNGVGTYRVSKDGQVTFTFNEQIENGTPVTSGKFNAWIALKEDQISGSTNQEFKFPIKGDANFSLPIRFFLKNNEDMQKKATLDKPMNPTQINWQVDFNKNEKPITDATFKDILPDGFTSSNVASLKVYKLITKLNGDIEQGDLVDLSTLNFTGITEANKEGFTLSFGTIDSAYRVEYVTKIKDTSIKSYNNEASVLDSGIKKMNADKQVDVKFSQPLDKKSRVYDSSTQTIEWTIEYNYNERSFDQVNAWVLDTFDDTQELIEDSFVVYKMEIANDGNATRKVELTETNNDFKIITPATDLTLTFPQGKTGFKLNFESPAGINNAYQIVYKTKSIPRIYADTLPVNNKVEMYDSISKDKTENLSQVIFNKNNGKMNFNSNKTIDWSIDLNRDNKTMTNVVIKDTFAGQGLEFLPGTLKVGSLKIEDGDYTIAPYPNSNYNEGFIIEFKKPVLSSQTITYTTKFDSKQSVSQYKNTAVLTWDGDGTNHTITKYGTADPDNYTKANGDKSGNYDTATRKIAWTVDFNYNLHTVQNPIIKDTYTGLQNFEENSVQVWNLELLGGADGVKVISEVSKDDYECKVTYDNDGKENGFELSFNIPITTAYRITYNTNFDNLPVTGEYINTAIISDGADPLKDPNKTATVNPPKGGEYVEKEGHQGKSANGEDPDYAYWTVNINSSQSHIDANAKLTDTLSSNQILVKDSFKLYNAKISKVGNDYKVVEAGLVDPTEYSIDPKDNSFILTFNNSINKPYILKYRSFIDVDKNGDEVSNAVNFEGQSSGSVNKPDNDKFNVALFGFGADAAIPKKDLEITKVDKADGNPLPGAVFGLYSGNDLISTQTTGVDGKVVFKGLRYKTYKLVELEAPKGYVAEQAYRVGESITINNQTVPRTIENEKGVWDFELTKVNKDEHTEKLEGAHYKLEIKDSNGYYVAVPDYADQITLPNGTISYKGLTKGAEYRVIETQAPIGFKLDPTPYVFTIDSNQTTTQRHTLENERYTGSVKLIKIDEFSKEKLEGVEFDLEDGDGNVLKSGLITDSNGEIDIPDLKSGTYKFVEKGQLVGYDPLLDPINVPVFYGENDDINQPLKITELVENKLTPGSVTLTKIEAGHPDKTLQGAYFKILDDKGIPVTDKDGKVINALQHLVTGQNGEFTVSDLRPGKYFFVEVTAPNGYYFISKNNLYEFEIVINQQTPELVTVENIRYVPSTGGGGGGGGGITPTPSPTPTPTPGPSPTPTPDPTKPVDPNPGTPVSPEPEKPVTPTKPKEKVTTPKQTPVKGKIGVPKDKTPKVSEKPKHGKVTIDPEGKWVYTPDKDYVGEDSFKIKVTDKDGNEEVYAVDVDVLPKDGTTGDTASSTGTGKTLPKTGESSQLPFQLGGLSLVILGTALLILRKRRLLHK